MNGGSEAHSSLITVAQSVTLIINACNKCVMLVRIVIVVEMIPCYFSDSLATPFSRLCY